MIKIKRCLCDFRVSHSTAQILASALVLAIPLSFAEGSKRDYKKHVESTIEHSDPGPLAV